MATPPKEAKGAGAKKPAATKPKVEYATKAELNELSNNVGELVNLIKSGALSQPAALATPAVATPETPEEKEVKKASPDSAPVNPEWEEKAREILGDALERCEVQYLRRGGTVFTVVIKNEHSNAPVEYLERMKVDRRSREIGNEGIEGVEIWCKLVAQNLRRPKF